MNRAGETTGAPDPSPWAIASPHSLSTEAGVEVFRAGGNAIDAALAAATSLTVTLPDNCALGGDLIALVRQPSGEVLAVNASGPAARGIDVDRLRRQHGDEMPIFGVETVTVPGLLAGWEVLWSLGAQCSWSRLFEAAIEQARDGVPAARSTVSELARAADRVSGDPGMREVFFAAGKPLEYGERLHQPQLASTLELLAMEGVRAFYDGPIGVSWLEAVRAAGSSLRAEDLSSYGAEVTDPLRATHEGEEILTAPPNSQGVGLLMTLRMLSELDDLLDPLSASASTLARIFAAVAEARTRYLADPSYSDVPVAELASATLPATPGASRQAHGRGDTVAIVTADGEGRAVSLIQSLFEAFGVGILDPRTGIISHNRGAFFSLDPTSPNVLAPGKRPAHTLTPVISLEGGDLRSVLGTMGGLAQTQVLTHVLLHLRRGMSPSDALTAPRWTVGGIGAGSSRTPVQAEGRVPRPALEALAADGWEIVGLSDFAFQAGEAQVITRTSDGRYSAASDPRSEGLALTHDAGSDSRHAAYTAPVAACATCGEENAQGARFCSTCGSPLPRGDGVPAARKTVTVLFCDVSGFTALGEQLDPESLHELLRQWFVEAGQVIARHGGTVEKFIGDAVMAVFGVPVLHEDDALRGARTALELRDTLADLNDALERRWGVRLDIHTGLNTGEASVGTAVDGTTSIMGDAVNVAQRLQSSASRGEVLVGEETAQLIRRAAHLEPLDPLAVKGRAARVPGWRLVSVERTGAGATTAPETPFVGRGLELRLLRDAMGRVSAERRPQLVTVLGPAGIGKSRLTGALLDELQERATAVVGRCLPYGEGITYWPVAEIVRQLSGAASEAALASLIGGGAATEESRRVASFVARATGISAGAVSAEETQWSVRRLLEGVAQREPLIVVVEDIHWAEPALLDLLEHLAGRSADVPLLILCLARAELLDDRPEWGNQAAERATQLRLTELSSGESEELLDVLAHGGLLAAAERTKLLAAAEGNPFFLQQMVAFREELGDDAATLPPTVQAVLTARIDRLPRGEREVIERASIEGRTFHRAPLSKLLPREACEALDASLQGLIRRQLIRPCPPDFPNEQGYRFEHILIRDATYSLIPKQLRANLHERYAGWLEGRAGADADEHAELAGYHLEQAFRWQMELQPAARHRYRPLASRAAHQLGIAGRSAVARDDTHAAINLLRRGVALLPKDDKQRGILLPELGAALTEAGRLTEAAELLDEAVAEAADRGDPVAEAHTRVIRLFARLQVDTEDAAREVRERFESLLATFEEPQDDLGLGRLWRLRALVHWIEARSADADAAWERSVAHAQSAADERGWSDALSWLASSAHIGPTPVADAIARCDEIRDQLRGHLRSHALVLDHLAALRAMRGEFEIARRLLAERRAIMAELGAATIHSAVSHDEALVALAAGDLAGAEVVLRAGYERLTEMGERALLATTAAMLAHVSYEQGRLDEAWDLTQTAEEAAAADDLSAQIAWRAVRSQLLARRGELREADRMSRDAVELAERTDWLCDHGDTLVARARVLQMAGDEEGAASCLSEATALYAQKGNTVAAQQARALLAHSMPA
jgi:gamma-glutamyltranspeptidase